MTRNALPTSPCPSLPTTSAADTIVESYITNASAPRHNTDLVLVNTLRKKYPQLHLSVIPVASCNLRAFASSGKAALAPIDHEKEHFGWLYYTPSPRRIDGNEDGLSEDTQFGKYLLDYGNREFVVYLATCRDGSEGYPSFVNQYVLSSSVSATNELLLEAGRWTVALHDEVLVFDGGFWQKSRELFDSVRHAEWDNVILSSEMKDALLADVTNFFDGRSTYTSLSVPWKRGVIYYGPPGNGKTISIKAMMHTLQKRTPGIPSLYVKTLASFGGPERSVGIIFDLARRYAPCYLIFEDLDTIITPNVRSYFFNEVDGLKSNDGIFMVGSTNHLDQLDPGISKRPSRFDRKYFFSDPDSDQREQYAHFWQEKLKDNKDLAFPDALCGAIAGITGGFSFAYMQEAFVASLLAIARRKKSPTGKGEDDRLHKQYTVQRICKTMARENREVPATIDVLDRTAEHYRIRVEAHTPLDLFAKDWNDLLAALEHASISSVESNVEDVENAYVRYAELTLGGLVVVGGHPAIKSMTLQDSVDGRWTNVAGVDTFRKTLRSLETQRGNQASVLADSQAASREEKRNTDDRDGDKPDLDELVLWKEIQKQVKILREEMDEKVESG